MDETSTAVRVYAGHYVMFGYEHGTLVVDEAGALGRVVVHSAGAEVAWNDGHRDPLLPGWVLECGEKVRPFNSVTPAYGVVGYEHGALVVDEAGTFGLILLHPGGAEVAWDDGRRDPLLSGWVLESGEKVRPFNSVTPCGCDDAGQIAGRYVEILGQDPPFRFGWVVGRYAGRRQVACVTDKRDVPVGKPVPLHQIRLIRDLTPAPRAADETEDLIRDLTRRMLDTHIHMAHMAHLLPAAGSSALSASAPEPGTTGLLRRPVDVLDVFAKVGDALKPRFTVRPASVDLGGAAGSPRQVAPDPWALPVPAKELARVLQGLLLPAGLSFGDACALARPLSPADAARLDAGSVVAWDVGGGRMMLKQVKGAILAIECDKRGGGNARLLLAEVPSCGPLLLLSGGLAPPSPAAPAPSAAAPGPWLVTPADVVATASGPALGGVGPAYGWSGYEDQ